jgi:hypothetical protein
MSYTPLMAKRFNVSIPDALAERLEPHKNKISLSAVMQAALERELAQLNLSDTDKQRRASLKAAATNAWLMRNPEFAKALGIFADHLLDSAINDGLPELFMYCRQLVIDCRREELMKMIIESPYIAGFIRCHLDHQDVYHEILRNNPDNKQHLVNRLIKIIVGATLDNARDKAADDGNMYFDDGFVVFIANQLKNGTESSTNLPDKFVGLALGTIEEPDTLDKQEIHELLAWHLGTLMKTKAAKQIALEILEDRIKTHLAEEEVNALILDFESEMADIAGMNQISIEQLESTNDV